MGAAVSRHVLLVDDEADIREVAKISLEAVSGWRVTTAASGAEALERAAADRPEAIVLDVMMPDLDGPAVVARLDERDETRAIPVILLTAKAQDSDRRRFEALGVAGMLAKPFDPMTLGTRIEALLGWGP